MSKNEKIFKKAQLISIEADFINFLNNEEKPNILGFSAPILLKHKKVLLELMFLYLHDDSLRPLSVGYSGGKDSTVTLDLVLKALMLIKYIYGDDALQKKTYVLFSDTEMELDPVISGIYRSLNEVRLFNDKYCLNLQVDKVSPEMKNNMWSLIIAKGYILPTPQGNRYCSQRLKTLPQKARIDEILKENNQGFIAITGQRQDESNDRKQRLEIQTIDGSFKQHDFKNCSLYTPIEHFSSNNVWDYIYTSSFEWVDKNELGRIYAEASSSDDECRSLLMGDEGMSPGCGKSGRFGCWCCPIHVSKDKTLINLGQNYPYLQKMEKFRNWLVADATGQWDWKRDVYIHGKHMMKEYDFDNHRKGMQLPGGYSLFYRKEILKRLMALELDILDDRKKALGGDGYLVSDEVLSYIQEIWIEDGDMEFSVSKICTHREVTISDKHRKAVKSASIMRDRSYYGVHNDEELFEDDWTIIEGLNKNVCSRYYTQMALQLEKENIDSYLFMDILRNTDNPSFKDAAIRLVRTLPVETRMDFVNSAEEAYIRSEWKRDELGFITFLERYNNKEIKKPQRTLFGFEGDYGEHFVALEELEKGTDIIEIDNELISVHDKMRYFDTW